MQVKVSHTVFVGLNPGRWLLYELDNGGNVVRVANATTHDGRINPNIVFVLEPPVAESTFRQAHPESTEVIEIMADVSLSNPSVIVEPTPNNATFVATVVTIPTAGTPVNLPSIVVPDGRALTVSSDVSNDPKKVVYVADSSANALLPAARATLSPGNNVKLFVTNANSVWIDTNLSGQKVVVVVEQ